MPATTVRTCCGLFTRRERWALSFRGWLVFLIIACVGAIGALLTVYPFLAITARSEADILAVEGWINDHAIRVAKDEFDTGRYRFVVATGGPVHGVGKYVNDYSTAASIGAGRLRRDGIPAERVHLAPSRISARDRTYSSAVALREWLHARGKPVRALNVVTEDVHARRTRLLFQAAFGSGVSVGVIAVPNPDYDATRWWRHSEGVRDVLSESISYLYAKFLFHPEPLRPDALTDLPPS